MIRGVNGSAASSFLLSNWNILPKRRRAWNRWLIDLLMFPDIVGRPITLHCTDFSALGSSTGIAVFLNVVLDQGVGRPL